MMTEISFSGYRFPPEIIQQAIWLYVRFKTDERDAKGGRHVKSKPHRTTSRDTRRLDA
jgi:transposase-like protein